MWISGPITTVYDEHICHELAAVARVGLVTRRWLSDKSRSAAMALGNNPISLGRGEYRCNLKNSIRFPGK
jgi:hypothetical protein